MFERIKHMLIKEFIQILRDPRMRGVLFIAPILQLLVFGYAVTTDVNHVTTAVYDLDGSASSRDLLARFSRSGYFDVLEHVGDESRVRRLLDEGTVLCVIRVNHGFEGDLLAGRTADVQLLTDGTDSNTARFVLDYASRIVGRYSQETQVRLVTRLMGPIRRPGQVSLETRSWFNDNLESRNYFVPGVMAMLILITTLMLTSMAIVREKEIGTMEQIMVTPITPTEFILGKTLPFVVIGYADVFIITAVAVLWFDVPIRGSLIPLLVATGLYLMTTIGIGLMISTLSRTQQQAMMTSFFFALPFIMLSGFMFPIANMPTVIQWLTYLDPLRYFLVVIRGVFLKGVGMHVLWPQMVGLAVLGVVTLAFASRKFHKTMA
jgi:ABC-2 type transport system permease protein